MYATQPGSEGTLGDMIALTPRFQEILTDAFQRLEMCSNDPLCRKQSFSEGKNLT